MKLENIVPWGRNLEEYRKMFLLSSSNLNSKILGCGDGPSSFNQELNIKGVKHISVDPIYQFSKDEIQERIEETSLIVSEQLRLNKADFIWDDIKDVDELVQVRLSAMNTFLEDFVNGKEEGRYVYEELPKLSFEKNSFDLVLSSHFLFLYSNNFDLEFHKKSILQMCEISKDEVRIFPIVDLNNQKSIHLDPIIRILNDRGYETKIVKTNYEFQKGANQMLRIKIL